MRKQDHLFVVQLLLMHSAESILQLMSSRHQLHLYAKHELLKAYLPERETSISDNVIASISSLFFHLSNHGYHIVFLPFYGPSV